MRYLSNQKGAIPLFALIAVIGLITFLAISSTFPFKNNLLSVLFPKDPSQAANSFLETFDGTPSTPIPWDSPNWDITMFETGRGINLDRFYAHHPLDCGVPIVDRTKPVDHVTNPVITHLKSGRYDHAIFQCNGHIMSATSGGSYGAIYMQPNHMVDFSQGEAVIKWDMATLQTSGRDWVSILLTPFQDNKQAYETGGTGGEIINGLMVDMHNGGFLYQVWDNYTRIQEQYSSSGGLDKIMQSPANRETFELRISKNYVKLRMPNVVWNDNGVQKTGMDFAFQQFNQPLKFDKAVFSIGQKAYTPDKGCINGFPPPCLNTWHFDNVSIAPSIPFTIIKADQRVVTQGTDKVVHFLAPAPANSFLRYAGEGRNHQFSIDGKNWINAQVHAKGTGGGASLNPYWTPIPAGTQRIFVRAEDENEDWNAHNFHIWSLNPLTTAPKPFSLPKPDPFQVLQGPFTAQYFNNNSLSGSVVATKTEQQIAYPFWIWDPPGDEPPIPPAPGVNGGDFSVRWTANINFPAGTYRFKTSIDDASRLKIDGKTLIDTWDHRNGSQVKNIMVDKVLTAGSHNVVVEARSEGESYAIVEYYKLSDSTSINNNPTSGQFKAEYFDVQSSGNAAEDFRDGTLFNGRTPVLVRGEDEVLLNAQGYGTPFDPLTEEKFAIRWTRTENFGGGEYAFMVDHDDAMRIFVDNTKIYDEGPGSVNPMFFSDITAGTHTIKVEYLEDWGNQRAFATWEPLNLSSIPSSTPIPTSTPVGKVGDLNNDNAVNALDFAILLSKWGSSDANADLNGDGSVGLVDFSILLSKWGT